MRNRIYEAESRAIQSIRRLQAEEVKYRAGHARYGDLLELKGASVDPAVWELADGFVAGYRIRINVSQSGYEISADRAAVQGLPFRSFYTDETGVIRYSFAPTPATRASPRTDGRPDPK